MNEEDYQKLVLFTKNELPHEYGLEFNSQEDPILIISDEELLSSDDRFVATIKDMDKFIEFVNKLRNKDAG